MSGEPAQTDFEQLLEYLQRTRGFDFGAYKRPSLERRIAKRMQEARVPDFGAYIDLLEVEPDEFGLLFNTILINVTSFFRDEAAWDYLGAEIVPRIAENTGVGPVRAWCAGCASGEEAYSLAMILAEALGKEALAERIKIYATDVDEDALLVARQARYSPKDVEPIPEALRKRYLQAQGGGFVFRPELRRGIIFGRHNLLKDPPMSKIDLLLCRNTLMYFNSEAQLRILTNMQFSLKETGFLFLGRAEMLLTRTEMFSPVNLKHRIFAKLQKPVADRAPLLGPDADRQAEAVSVSELRGTALEFSPIAQIVVDRDGTLVAANRQARASFVLTLADVGRPLQDLEISYRPLELRSRIDEALAIRRAVRVSDVERTLPGGDVQNLWVDVVPVYSPSGGVLGVTVSFTDTTPVFRVTQSLERAKHDLETAYEELQSSNEELETTNEELQSTVEELETTNEELQSTNEELETMNEELQSTNAELQTINDELGERTLLLDKTEAFLTSIMESVRVGVVVLDNELRVSQWSGRSEDMWGVRAPEVEGRSFLDLDIGLPVRELEGELKASLAGGTDVGEIVLEATNRRGKPTRCAVTVAQLRSGGSSSEIEGIVLLMEERAV